MLHPHLIELSAWPWLERLSQREGRRVTLRDVPASDWDALAKRGFDLVFLMGVWRRSPFGREIARSEPDLSRAYDRALPGWTAADVVGSPYCIQDYVPDDRMGSWDGLTAARRELNSRGIGLVLDFVPNHTAFDHPWIAEHPDRYVPGSMEDCRTRPGEFREIAGRCIACGRDPYFPPWTDVAQLNYANPETRVAMVGLLREVAGHCDGVRCDMAMLILNDVFERTWRGVLRDRWPMPAVEFWPEATTAVPRLVYVAEVYWDREYELQQQGFDYTYDKRLLDRLHGAPASDVRAHLAAEPSFRDRLARFLENHDEARSAAVFGPRLPAAATLLAILPGMRFFFDGQLEGARVHTPVQLGRWREESPDRSVADLYRRLLDVTRDDLFHAGDWRLLDVSPAGDGSFDHLVACRWKLDRRLAVVAANLGSAEARGCVRLGSDVPESSYVVFDDVLTDETHRRDRVALLADGLEVALAPGQAHLLLVRGD